MKNILLYILTLVSLFSCNSFKLAMITKKNIANDVKVLKNDSSGQTIVFLPMVHIGKEEYYKSVREVIDSLREINYSFYYESIAVQDSISPLLQDTLDRKLRKVVGFHISENYADRNNNSLPKAIKNSKYVMQDYKFIGIKKSDNWLDLPQNKLITRYEENYKPIKLLPCDFETDLYAKYNCKDTVKHNEFYMINLLRDYYIVDKVLNSNEPKICMIYGKRHWFVMGTLLRKNGFKIIYGKY